MFDNLLKETSRLWGLALTLAIVSVVMAVLSVGGLPTAILVMAAIALAGAIFVLYSSIINLTGQSEMTLDEALTLVAPSREEERKRAVLRTLKDLEYERSVGKITDEDYTELTARYREEAKRLLRAVEEARADQLAAAEALVTRHLEELQRAAEQAAARDDDTDEHARHGAVADAAEVAEDGEEDLDDDIDTRSKPDKTS